MVCGLRGQDCQRESGRAVLREEKVKVETGVVFIIHQPGIRGTDTVYNTADYDRIMISLSKSRPGDEIHKYSQPLLRVVKTMKISARNQIPGTVKMIKKGPVRTHSAESLKLKEGSKVYAIVKASEVMIGID